MTWIKLDANFPDHPKVVRAGPNAAWLYVCGLMWSARMLTDGHIPAGQVNHLADMGRPDRLAKRLVDAGLWVRCEDGFTIHNYRDWQTEAGTVEAKRLAENARKRRAYTPKSPPILRAEVSTEVEVEEKRSTPLTPHLPDGDGARGTAENPVAADEAAVRAFNLAELRKVKIGRRV